MRGVFVDANESLAVIFERLEKPGDPKVLIHRNPDISSDQYPAIHAGEAARAFPHQRDGAFGHRRIAIALDQVHFDAELRELFGIHVAARAGAEEHHVLQPGALFCNLGRQRGVIDDRDLRAI